MIYKSYRAIIVIQIFIYIHSVLSENNLSWIRKRPSWPYFLREGVDAILWLIITEFIGFTVFVAVLSWAKTRNDDLSTKDGYFLAGRSLPGIVIAGSLMMTNLSAEQLVGTNGQSFAGNMSAMAWEATSAFALAILAFAFLPRMLKGGITTLPEFFRMRYDDFTMRMFAVMFMIAYIFTMLPVILYSGSVALVSVFNVPGVLHISYFHAIALMCILAGLLGMAYAVFGGLKAIAYSDTINGAGLIIGGFMVPVLAMFALGKMDGGGFFAGIHHLITATPSKMNAWSKPDALPPQVPWPLLFTGMLVNNLFYWGANQSIIQRALGAKNLAEAQKGSIWAGFFKCLDVFVIVLPGIIAYQMFGIGHHVHVGVSADQAYPKLVMTVVPKPLLGFLAAVMLGAILSSFNSVLNSASTIFTLDFYHPLFSPDADNQQVVRTGKRFGTIVGFASIAISPFIMYFSTGILNFINECWGFFSMPILTALLFGLFTKKAPAAAPKITVPLHIILYGISRILPCFRHIHYLYVVFGLFLLECAVYGLCIKFAPAETEKEIPDAHVMDMTPWKTGKLWCAVGMSVVVLMYIIFSPLVLAK